MLCPMDTQSSLLTFCPFQANAGERMQQAVGTLLELVDKLLTLVMFSHKMFAGSLLGEVLWLVTLTLRHIPFQELRLLHFLLLTLTFFRKAAHSQVNLEQSFLSK